MERYLHSLLMMPARDKTIFLEYKKQVLFGLFISSAGIFLLDVSYPGIYTLHLLYILPIWVTFWLPARQTTVIVTALSAVLVFTGWFFTDWKELFSLAVISKHLLALGYIAAGGFFTYYFKQVFQKYVAEERLLSSVLRTAAEGILIVDKDGEIRYTNPHAEKILGYKASELNGKKIEELIPIPHREKHVLHRHDFLTSPRTSHWSGKAACVRRDGNEIPLEISLGHFNLEGKPYVTCFIEDISKKVAQEKKILEMNSTLARTNTELLSANEDLEQIINAFSHELQEPMRMTSIYSQILAGKCVMRSSEEGIYLQTISEGAHRMKQLIDGLHRYLQIRPHHRETSIVNCEEIVDSLQLHYTDLYRELKPVFHYEALPEVKYNADNLKVLLNELIENGIKFRKSDPPVIRIMATELGGTWQFSVTSNSFWIDKEYEEKIFMIYKKLHTRDEYPGAGLGLSIAKRIVEQHGGKIWFDSAEDEGTSFHFTIPK